MGQPLAKVGDSIVNAADIHIVLVPGPGEPVPTPLPFPFNGKIAQMVSTNVRVNGQFAAIVGSMAMNEPPHLPEGGTFETPPTNLGRVTFGSTTVKINNKGAARAGDMCETCHDVPPEDTPQEPMPLVVVEGMSNVLVG
jgi:uncharacterized Zn-binding protein involved in type VI secretion